MNSLPNKKIKVLVCAFACLRDPDTRFGFGKGGESGLGWNIILQISRFGEAFVLTDSGNRKEIEEKLKESALAGVNFYYISLPSFLNFTKKWIQIYAYLWQIKAYFFAKKLNNEKHFDLFHHLTYANDWMASYIGAFLPVPFVRGPGGGAQKVPSKFLSELSLNSRLAQYFRSFCQWILRHDPVFMIGRRKAKAILVCTQESKRAIPEKYKFKTVLFPVNGISKKDFDNPADKKTSAGKFRVITAGKLIPIKGFGLAIKAFKIFNGRHPDSELVIVGDGPELANLKNLAGELKIGDNVLFKGWQPREELLQEVSLSDIFLFASLRDGGGAVVVEAMAASKPVVCLDIAGPGLHIDDRCGIKIKPENPEQAVKDMAEALGKLYLNKDLRLQLGAAAGEKAEKNYDWDKLGDKLNGIYKNIFQF